ncbi:MAG TPA: DUF3574 domain-containing protein [Bacteroidota bacterium]|nr:DUF3574 domain-containing protein [Bacteroidota bacterium]
MVKSAAKHRIAFVALSVWFSACSSTGEVDGQNSVMIEQLFFGRNLHGVEVVSDSAWSIFLETIVTPRFPSGFTVWQAEGQWLASGSQLEKERSFVLMIVRPQSATLEEEIKAIIAEYKKRFQQEAVLRLTFLGRAFF